MASCYAYAKFGSGIVSYSAVPAGYLKFFWGVVYPSSLCSTCALGYLMVYGRRLRRSQRLDLPEWSEMDWPSLFIDGLRMLSLLFCFVGVPLLVGWVVSLLLFL